MTTVNKGVISILCCAAIAVSGVGCGGKKDAVESGGIGTETLKASGYPINTDETLSLWMRHNVGRSVEGYDSPNDYPRVEEMQKQTGVKLDIQYADVGMEEDQFNALLASENLPDMIYYDWMNIPGGADRAIRDGYIISLNDVMKDYSPNFCKYMEENPTLSKMSRTDSGSFYMYPAYSETGEEKNKENNRSEVSGGYVMRKDWLDELNMQPPETIDEWYVTLKAFKEKKGAAAPFTESYFDKVFSQGMLAAYGLSNDFYRQGSRVLFAPAQPAYRDYLTQMHRWYEEGLVNENIINADYTTLQDNMLNGYSGVAFAWLGSGMGTWIREGKKIDPDYDLIGLKPPVLEKGTKSFGLGFLPVSGLGVAISAGSEKKELAAKFLDYGYSEEGMITYNFGIEGVSFEYKDGEPEYIPQSEEVDRSDFLTLYTFSSGNWAKRGSEKVKEFYYTMPQQKQAAEAFSQVEGNIDYLLPPISPSVDEATEIGQLERSITRYAEDMRDRFIVGTEPLDNFDAYLETLNEMGLPRLMELKQAALDRYNRR